MVASKYFFYSLMIASTTFMVHGYKTGTVNHIKTEKELNEMLSSGKAVVVKFEAEWCGPCKASKQPYAKIAENHTDVIFAAVDVDQAKALGDKYKIKSLPTVIIFDTTGKQFCRETGFNSSTILNKIKSFEGTKATEGKKKEPAKEKPAAHCPTPAADKTEPVKTKSAATGTVTEIKNKAHFDKTIKDNRFVVAKFGAEWCVPCKDAEEPYGYIAEAYTNVTFVTIDVDNNKDIQREYQVRSLPTFLLFKDGKKVDEMVSFFDPALRSKVKDLTKGTKSAMSQINFTDGPTA